MCNLKSRKGDNGADSYESNQRFRDYAKKLGLNLTYDECTGGHTWDYWDRQIQGVLAWLTLQAKLDNPILSALNSRV